MNVTDQPSREVIEKEFIERVMRRLIARVGSRKSSSSNLKPSRIASRRTVPQEECDLSLAEVFANQMCCRDASDVLFGLWTYRRMFHSIVAILDINMGRLVDIAHRDILIVASILAAGAQA